MPGIISNVGDNSSELTNHDPSSKEIYINLELEKTDIQEVNNQMNKIIADSWLT